MREVKHHKRSGLFTQIAAATTQVWRSYPVSLFFGLCGTGASLWLREGSRSIVLPAILSLFMGVALDMIRSIRKRLGEIGRYADAVEQANAATFCLVEAINEDTQHLIAARKAVQTQPDVCFGEIADFTLQKLRNQKYNFGTNYLTVTTPHLCYLAYIGFWKYCVDQQRSLPSTQDSMDDLQRLTIRALHFWTTSFWETTAGVAVLEESESFIKEGGSIDRIVIQRSRPGSPAEAASLLKILTSMTEIGITVFYMTEADLGARPETSFAVVSQPDGNAYSVSLQMTLKPREPIKAFIRKNSREVVEYLRAWGHIRARFDAAGLTPFSREVPPTFESIAR